MFAPRHARRIPQIGAIGAVLLGTACRREEPPSAVGPTLDGAPPSAAPVSSIGASSNGATTAFPSAATSNSAPHGGARVAVAPSGASSTAPGPSASSTASAAHEPDPLNKSRPPQSSEDLQERAAHLIDAIAKNDSALADDFFFPKAPFIPLKDVADPGRYFDQLLATYHRDIASLRNERKDWTGATFVSFELGTTPTWVAPGKEYNKIGYYRTFGGKLRYRIGDKNLEMKVSTIISWDGRWYVTHLSPIRH